VLDPGLRNEAGWSCGVWAATGMLLTCFWLAPGLLLARCCLAPGLLLRKRVWGRATVPVAYQLTTSWLPV